MLEKGPVEYIIRIRFRMCMKAPIYDFVIGKIAESRGLEELDQDVNSEEVVAVTTRAQEKREKLAIKPLPLMEEPLNRVSVDLIGPLSPVSEKRKPVRADHSGLRNQTSRIHTTGQD